ncbi:MAG: carbonic anhydrase [Myxococcota bacterium]
MNSYEKLLLENKLWSEQRLAADKNYFQRLARHEDPEFLWIGGSDSRVHPNEITGSHPGEILIHRNFGNIVHPDDRNLGSLLRHALVDLQVEHIIVCGHTACEATRLAIRGTDDPWLAPLSQLAQSMKADLQGAKEPVKVLVEASVRAQVESLSRHALVVSTWAKRKAPTLHGWIFDVETGRIRDLVAIGPDQPS